MIQKKITMRKTSDRSPLPLTNSFLYLSSSPFSSLSFPPFSSFSLQSFASTPRYINKDFSILSESDPIPRVSSSSLQQKRLRDYSSSLQQKQLKISSSSLQRKGLRTTSSSSLQPQGLRTSSSSSLQQKELRASSSSSSSLQQKRLRVSSSSLQQKELRAFSSSSSFQQKRLRISSSSLQQKRLIHLVLILLQVATGVLGVVVHEVRVPQPGINGHPAELECLWETEENNFYSVRWYLNEEQFYSFITGNDPEKVNHDLPGIRVSMADSGPKVVTIIELTPDTEGLYRCEVMTEAPMFETAVASANLTVVNLPKKPELHGVSASYKAGDTLSATCTARHARPPATLAFYVNGALVRPDSGRVQKLGMSSEVGGSSHHHWGVYTTTSRLVLPLSSSHAPTLTLSCHAQVLTLKVETTLTAQVEPPRKTMFSFFNAGIVCCLPAPFYLLMACSIHLIVRSP